MPYGYAQLPIYHYHTFDRRNLQFTPVPVFLPPPPPPPTLEIPSYPPDSDNDEPHNGAGDEALASDDAPPDDKLGRHHLTYPELSDRDESRD